MLNKAHWEGTKEKFKAFWNHEYDGRCLMNLKAYNGDKSLRIKGESWAYQNEYDSLQDFYLNPETIIKRNLHYMNNTYYAAEAFPSLVVNLGPGILAGYFGSKVNFGESTIWFEEYIKDWSNDLKKFEEDNFWWQKTKEITKKAVEASKGRYLVGIVDLNSVSNALSLVRGSGELAMDLIDCPEQVIKARDIMLKRWFYCLQELYNITKNHQQGYTDWMGMWAPDLGFAVQCDFSTLISTDMFNEFFLPEIQEQCKRIPYTLYHLDGPACIRHVDSLLEIPELKGIQWQPGAGAAPAADPQWISLLQKIQQKGKNVYVYAKLNEVDTLIENLDPSKLYINITEYIDNPEEAEAFINKVEKQCMNKR